MSDRKEPIFYPPGSGPRLQPPYSSHLLVSDHNGDPTCVCGYRPVPPEATSQMNAAMLIRKHVKNPPKHRAPNEEPRS